VLVADPARPEITPTEHDDTIFGDHKINAEPPRIDPDVFRSRAVFTRLLTGLDAFKIDLVFNGLHGGAGEDGTVQAVMEYLGIKFTGAGSAGCAFAMDKQRAKILAAEAGVRVPAGLYFERSALHAGTLEQQVRESVGLPAVVKPNAQGSSVGLTIVHDFKDLDAAAQRAFEVDRSILVERFIEGREITQAILEDGPDLPVLEIRPKSGLYDYFHKYQSGNTEYLVPAPIDESSARETLDAAKRAFTALNLSVYTRFDFRLDPDGHPWLLEANTLPGMTAQSLVPKAAAVVGMSYNVLCEFIVNKSMEKQRVA